MPLVGLTLLVGIPACAPASGSEAPPQAPQAVLPTTTETPPLSEARRASLPPLAPRGAASAEALPPSLAAAVCLPLPRGALRFPRDFASRVPATQERIRQALATVRAAFPDLLADLVLDSSDDQRANLSYHLRDVPSAYGRDGIEVVERCIASEFDRLEIPQMPLSSFRLVRSR